jgi:hypothetical protein
MKSRRVGQIAAALTLTTALAWSQQAAPPPAKTDAPADEETKTAAPAVDELSLGVYGWNFVGNRQRLLQYAMPANGVTVNAFRLLTPAVKNEPYLRITASGAPAQDFVIQGLSIFDKGRGSIYTSNDRFGFSNTTPIPVSGNQDHETRNDLTFMLTPDLALMATYRSRGRDLSFEPPISGQSYRTANYAVGVEGKMLSGEAALSFDGETFNDETGAQPDWTRNRYQVHYGGQLSTDLALEGSASTTEIDQSGAPDGRINVYTADANLDISPTSSLFFELENEGFSLPAIQNAYVQRRTEGSIRYEGRFAKQRLGLGIEHKEESVLNAAHTYVDIPTWNDVDGRLSGRLSNTADYAFTFNWERFNKGAQLDPTDADDDDPLALYWNDRVQSQFRLEGDSDRFQWYASESFSLQRNDSTDVQLRSYDSLVGASFNYKVANTAFVEVSHQVYAAQGDQNLAGLSLNQFFPAGTSISCGLTRQLSPKASLSLSLNHTFTDYVNPMELPGGNVRSTQFTVQYAQQIGKDCSLSAILSPWTYQDAYSYLAGYHATLFGLTFTKKF